MNLEPETSAAVLGAIVGGAIALAGQLIVITYGKRQKRREQRALLSKALSDVLSEVEMIGPGTISRLEDQLGQHLYHALPWMGRHWSQSVYLRCVQTSSDTLHKWEHAFRSAHALGGLQREKELLDALDAYVRTLRLVARLFAMRHPIPVAARWLPAIQELRRAIGLNDSSPVYPSLIDTSRPVTWYTERELWFGLIRGMLLALKRQPKNSSSAEGNVTGHDQ